MTKAWMLRQDGNYWEVKIHLYGMNTDDLSSEAECASFLISTNSQDKNLCKQTLDAWMALLIEDKVSFDMFSSDIDDCILSSIHETPYKFPFPLDDSHYLDIHNSLGNFFDIDSYYEFLDEVKNNLNAIQEDIKRSLNQQFCRVRFGGMYDSEVGSNSLWFRISSVGFNWVNTIYEFVSNHHIGLGVTSIFICRDAESDNSEIDYFYKAKDGEYYFDMPVDEYLEESHEHSPVFSKYLGSGVYTTIYRNLCLGQTYDSVLFNLRNLGLTNLHNCWNYFIKKERNNCIEASEFLDNASIRTKMKISSVARSVIKKFPEISSVDIDVVPRENTKGNMVGFECHFILHSRLVSSIDDLEIYTVYTKPLNTISGDTLLRNFTTEYTDYLKNRGIDVTDVNPVDGLLDGYVWH